jgi:hypothetical protein
MWCAVSELSAVQIEAVQKHFHEQNDSMQIHLVRTNSSRE